MDEKRDIMRLFADEFKIPIINKDTSVWFFRTQSGKYYIDFYLNNYIALGWDLVSKNLISDTSRTEKDKKRAISDLYPNERRPGLIWGQMDTFFNKMQVEDFVIIPTHGGRKIAIGLLGDITLKVG